MGRRLGGGMERGQLEGGDREGGNGKGETGGGQRGGGILQMDMMECPGGHML